MPWLLSNEHTRKKGTQPYTPSSQVLAPAHAFFLSFTRDHVQRLVLVEAVG